MEKKKKLIKNDVIKERRNREKKENRGRQREKSMGREEVRGGDSEGAKRDKKNKEKIRSKRVYCEKC